VPSDIWRYYLLSHRPETSDSEFEWERFVEANNNELLKNLGNFVNRVLKFVASPKVYDSVVSEAATLEGWPEAIAHVKAVGEVFAEYLAELDAVKLRSALSTAMRLSALGNKLLQDHKLDFKLAAEQRADCDALVLLALNHVHLLASVMRPFMPTTSESIVKMLGLPTDQMPCIPDRWDPISEPKLSLATAWARRRCSSPRLSQRRSRNGARRLAARSCSGQRRRLRPRRWPRSRRKRARRARGRRRGSPRPWKR